MPPPNNNANQQGPQGPAQTGPSQTASNPFADMFKGFQGTPELKSVVELLTKVLQLLTKQDTYVQSTTKHLRDYGNELRSNMKFIEEIEESTKKLAKHQKEVTRSILKTHDLKGVRDILKEMADLTKTQSERGIWSPQQTRVLKRNAREIEAALKQVNASNKDAFSADHLGEVSQLWLWKRCWTAAEACCRFVG